MAFGFLIVYVVLVLVRPQEWWEPLRDFQLVNVTAIVTILATFVSQRPHEPLQRIFARNLYAKFMWAFLGVIVLSDLTKLRLRYAVDGLSEFGKISILFFLVMILVDTPQRLRRMMWVVVFCAGLMTIHGMMQVQTGEGFGHIRPFGSWEGGDFRIKGTGLFGDPNDFALLFIVSTAFAVSLLRSPGAFLSKAVLLCIIAAMLASLYYTKSRGGLAGFCAMIMAIVWIAGRRSMLRLIISAILIAGVVMFGPTRSTETVFEGSAGGRIEAWGIGNDILKHSPLFGAGYGRFFDFSGNRAAHSSFVNCYAELGLIGYIVWVALLWFIIRALIRISRLKDDTSGVPTQLAAGVFSALVGYIAAGFFLTRTYNPLLYLLLGLGVGLIRHVQRQPAVPSDLLQVTNRDLFRAAMMALLSIPAIWLLIRFYWSGAAS